MKVRSVVAVFFGIAIGCQLMLAQVSTGTISGVVQDNTGAVIPGAAVVVRNADTGISRTLATDAAGRYQALNLNPGNYEVEGQVSGFQTEIRRGIVITVGRQAIVNLSLQVGAVTETVEVTGEAPLIETRTSTLGALVNQQTIESMPLNGRSWDQLALLQAGITPYSGGTGKSFGDSQGTKFSVAGSRSYSNSFLLDGTDINGHGNSTPGGASGVNMGVDAIREFQVITNAFSAEHGRATGAVVSAITKSGTNQLHGSVFEFFRNDNLDAAEYGFYDDPANDIKARPPFVQNQFGGTIGGPIVRDRTFFLAAFEALRRRRGEPNVPIVPSADGHNGILGRNDDGTPKTTVAISPRMQPFLDIYPVANDPESVDLLNNGLGFFITAPSVATNQNYVLGRVDHQINDSHSIFGRYAFDQDKVIAPGGTYGIPGFTTEQYSRKQYVTAQVSSILTPTVLNHFRVAFNRTGQFEDELPDERFSGPEYSFIRGLPMGLMTTSGTIATASGRGLANLGTDNTFPRLYYYNLFEYGDDLSVIRGSHTMKFGANLKRMRDNAALNTTLRGRYNFSNFTNFLRGVSNRFDYTTQPGDPRAPLSVGHAYRGLRQWFIAGYAQDDWQVTPRLTLNLGLRYETVTNPKEVNNLAARLVNITDREFSVEPEVDSYFDIAKKTFQPRFGFAWQLNDSASTVIRGGAGIFHDQPLPHLYSTQVEKYPPYYNLAQNPRPNLTFDDLTSGTVRPRVNAVSTSIQMGTKYHWNLTVQQQIGQNNVIEIGYVGAKAHNLPKFNELSTPFPFIRSDGSKCFGFRTAAQKAAGTGSDNPLCPEATSDRRNPNFDELRTIEYVGQSLYNGMQAKFTRRTNAGGQFQFLYTWSRAMDNASTTASGDVLREPQSALDPIDSNVDYSRASFDAVNNFSISYTYPLPFQGQGVLGALVGGWEIAGITSIVSGSPYTIRSGSDTDRNRDGGRSDRPDLAPGFSNNPTEGTSAGCADIDGGPIGRSVESWNKTSRWHDICAFQITNLGVYGNLGRNTVLGPGRLNFDFSLHKSFPVTEGMDIQFRAEMFNIFNRNNLGLPENQGFDGLDYEPSAGTILPGETVTRPREIQFGLKLVF